MLRGPGSRASEVRTYTFLRNVCGRDSASALRRGCRAPAPRRWASLPLDPGQPCADWIRAMAFPPWTWTQKGLAPPRPPASWPPRPDTTASVSTLDQHERFAARSRPNTR